MGPTVLAMGSFDGVHVGHRAVLKRVVEEARRGGWEAACITFDPHPRCVLDPGNCPAQITMLDERLELVASLGLAHAIVLGFTRELAALTAGEFMARLLQALQLECLVAGPDFALGRRRQGDLSWLRDDGRQRGYEVIVVDPVRLDGEEVHSSDVRRLLTGGEVEAANRLLGREFGMAGLVKPGDQIGQQIGWPTANLSVPPAKLVPGRGIYAGWADTPGGHHGAAISIGYRPTFEKADLRVEAHILEFSGDLYEQPLRLSFVARLRDEIKFANAAALSDQIAQDVAATRRLLGQRRD